MTIYDRIKKRRIELGMSQAELARRVGYHGKSVISKVENGERDISHTMIVKYAEVLGVSATYLLMGKDETNQTEKPAEGELSEIEADILSRIMALSPEKQKQMNDYLDFLLSQQDGECQLVHNMY